KFTELCRLEDFKGTNGQTCRLSPDSRFLVAVGTDPKTVGMNHRGSVLRVWDVSALHPIAVKKMKKLSGDEREQLWDWLFKAHPDPETANILEFSSAQYYLALQAMASLVMHGDDAVPWLKKKLGAPFDLKQLPQLIADLDSPKYPARQAAT